MIFDLNLPEGQLLVEAALVAAKKGSLNGAHAERFAPLVPRIIGPSITCNANRGRKILVHMKL